MSQEHQQRLYAALARRRLILRRLERIDRRIRSLERRMSFNRDRRVGGHEVLGAVHHGELAMISEHQRF